MGYSWVKISISLFQLVSFPSLPGRISVVVTFFGCLPFVVCVDWLSISFVFVFFSVTGRSSYVLWVRILCYYITQPNFLTVYYWYFRYVYGVFLQQYNQGYISLMLSFLVFVSYLLKSSLTWGHKRILLDFLLMPSQV